MIRIERIADQSVDRQAELIALNNEHAQETSFLSPEAWNGLVSAAYDATCTGADGFLITFDQTADYGSPNFIWFKHKYDRFVYVDRIVVAASARGRGIARHLYQQLFEVARRDGHGRVACEVNITPRKPRVECFSCAHGIFRSGPSGHRKPFKNSPLHVQGAVILAAQQCAHRRATNRYKFLRPRHSNQAFLR